MELYGPVVTLPITANHLSPAPFVTKTIGARHCAGSVTDPLISELPAGVAGKGSVMTLTVTIPPPPLISLRQLTNPRNVASVLVPTWAAGTDGSFVNTRPRTSIRRWPLAL